MKALSRLRCIRNSVAQKQGSLEMYSSAALAIRSFGDSCDLPNLRRARASGARPLTRHIQRGFYNTATQALLATADEIALSSYHQARERATRSRRQGNGDQMSEQPFDGVTVLELGQFVAVPWAGQVLADGGAHVIKVEPLEGEPSRHIAPLAPHESRHFVIRNRGKHSLPLDFKHADAREILDALLRRADVVLINMRPGLAAELGVGYEQLAPRHPRLIVGSVTAFGPRGPDAALAGMDMVVQARSGLMVTGGKVSNGLPTTGKSPIADYMAAALLAFGVAAALYRRERTGRGGRVTRRCCSRRSRSRTT